MFNLPLQELDYLRVTRVEKQAYVDNPFDDLSDDELLNLDPHIYVEGIRTVANDGIKVLRGDVVHVNDAVVRVSDEDATVFDYQVNLVHDARRPDLTGLGPANLPNMTFMNHRIAPRVVNIHPPKRTRLSSAEASTLDILSDPLVSSFTHAYMAIQAAKKMDLDYEELARVLGSAWGDRDMFDPYSPADFLGDISLPRYLAKCGKIRYENYRGPAWDVLVAAICREGYSAQHGLNAIVDWDRRTTLARSLVQNAIQFEGVDYGPNAFFSIRARIQAGRVVYGDWSQFNIHPEDILPLATSVPNYVRQYRDLFSQASMNDILVHISAGVYARYGDLAEVEAARPVMAKYARMEFLEDIHDYPDSSGPDDVIAIRAAKAVMAEPHHRAVIRTRDPVVAFCQLLAARSEHDLRLGIDYPRHINLLDTLTRINARVANSFGSRQRRRFYNKFYIEVIPLFSGTGSIWAEIYNNVMCRGRVDLWARCQELMDGNPHAVDIDKCRDPMAFGGAMLWGIITGANTKGIQTIRYQAKELAARLRTGVRSRGRALVASADDLVKVVAEDTLATCKRVYVPRYRARGIMNLKASRCAPSRHYASGFSKLAIQWYSLSDVVKGAYIYITGSHVTVGIHDSALRRAWECLYHNATVLLGRPRTELKLSGIALSDLPVAIQTWATHNYRPHDGFPTWLTDRLVRFLRDHAGDYDYTEELVAKRTVEPLGATISMKEFATVPDYVAVDIDEQVRLALTDAMRSTSDTVDLVEDWVDMIYPDVWARWTADRQNQVLTKPGDDDTYDFVMTAVEALLEAEVSEAPVSELR